MIAQMARVALVLASVGALAEGASIARMPLESGREVYLASRAQPVATDRRSDPDSVLLLARRAAPFRLRRMQPAIRYDPTRATAAAAPAPPAPPKPALLLSGIVLGEAPFAALEGIPGVDGTRLLGRGDTIAGLRVRRVEPGAVTITGYDTTWVLKVRETWQ